MAYRYVADTGRIFWYNHLNKTSHWERPYILWRYGDVKMPLDWIPIDVPTVSPEELAADNTKEQMYALHYWHVKGTYIRTSYQTIELLELKVEYPYLSFLNVLLDV